MTVQAANADFFNFVGGLNTEAGFFNIPQNSWKEGDNVIPTVKGELKKRLAVDLESGFMAAPDTYSEASLEDSAFFAGEWDTVGGNGSLVFDVVQWGRYVYFYRSTSVALSSNRVADKIDLATYQAAGNPNTIGSARIAIANASGKLLISSRDTDPILVEYNAATDTISETRITIKIRDFDGVDDGLGIDERPTTLSAEHSYNLSNQGWGIGKRYGKEQVFADFYFSETGFYPSNAQIWTYGKNADGVFTDNALDRIDFGTTPAPKGRFILSLFNQDRSAESGVSGLPVVSYSERPTTCAFFAGRTWYAGLSGDQVSSYVLFSQVSTKSDNYGKCYQDADPTSETISDLIDTDGGIIPIQEAGTILSLVPFGDGVVVLATNGVWFIVGTANSGFSAKSYEVRKVSSFGAVGANSILRVEDRILYWSQNGIYILTTDQTGLNLSAASMTDNTIKTLYTSVPSLSKTNAVGAYNNEAKLVFWFYNSDGNAEFSQGFDKALVLDTRLNAFYTMSFGGAYKTHPRIVGAVTTRGTTAFSVEELVYTDAYATVTDESLADVTVDVQLLSGSVPQFKLMVAYPDAGVYKLTFADFLNNRDAPEKFYDWFSFNNVGVPFDCFFVTGYAPQPTGPSRYTQAPYITTFMNRTETGFSGLFDALNESSCTMQARWDFTDSAAANKWGAGQEIYRHNRPFIPAGPGYDDGYPLVITKNKVRGRGKALQLKFTANQDKDMQVVGWSAVLIGGANV